MTSKANINATRGRREGIPLMYLGRKNYTTRDSLKPWRPFSVSSLREKVTLISRTSVSKTSPPILASSLTRGKVTTPNTVHSGTAFCASSWSVMLVASVVLRLIVDLLLSTLVGLWTRRLLPSSTKPSSMSMMTSRGLSGEPLSARREELTIQYSFNCYIESFFFSFFFL